MFQRLSNMSKRLPTRGLEEFVDTSRVSSTAVTYGRAWKACELERKSFEDLHKLWYVLLKEKNVLLTERYDAQRRNVRWQHPERLDRVNCSMARIKTVLKNREIAYKKNVEVQKASAQSAEGYKQQTPHEQDLKS